MSELMVAEQVVLTGNVDIPYSNENMIKLLQLFASDNYVPNVVQEVSADGAMAGRAQNRISFVDARGLQISFFSNRIQIVRAPMPGSAPAEGFIEVALNAVAKIASAFSLSAGRCIVAKEKMMSDASQDKVEKVRNIFVGSPFPEANGAYEWFVRNAFVSNGRYGELIDIFEASRAHGVFIQDGVSKKFDRVRFKTESATDVQNESPRFDIREAPEILRHLWEMSERRFAQLERLYHEA